LRPIRPKEVTRIDVDVSGRNHRSTIMLKDALVLLMTTPACVIAHAVLLASPGAATNADIPAMPEATAARWQTAGPAIAKAHSSSWPNGFPL